LFTRTGNAQGDNLTACQFSSVALKLTLLGSTPDAASVMAPETTTFTIAPFGGQSVAG
jgi:hypothetical protein